MKRAVSFFLVLAMLVGYIGYIPVNVTAATTTAIAALPRYGYTLVPTLSGTTGIDISSEFILTTPSRVTPMISIDGQPSPAIVQENADTFRIIPAAPLASNTLYIFRLEREGQSDITWAFQTTVRFQITSNFPADQATNVPINTGIEVAFTSNAHRELSEFFSIYPNVEGRFINRGNTTIFMPTSPLEHQQLYTVTVRAGIGLDGTNEILTEDHVFSFETAPEREPVLAVETILLGISHLELPSFEPPIIDFLVSSSPRVRDFTRSTVNVNVYQFDNNEQAIEAVQQLMGIPHWTRFAWQNKLLDTTELENIMSFEVYERLESTRAPSWSSWESLELPDYLPPGFYLINVSVDDFHDQMVLQITDLAIQIVADNDSAIVWVNDMTTGRPAVGARVYDSTLGRTYETDANGIVIIERALPNQNGDYLAITTSGGKECYVFFTAHRGFMPWRSPGQTISYDYWTVLQLDRTLFQRDDTLYFWGFVESRNSTEAVQYVSAVLSQGGWQPDGRHTLHRQTVPVQYGIYSDEIQLPNLNPGSYVLTIFHDDIAVSSIFFSVQDYVTPPYRLLVSADRRAVFEGDTATFTARTEFFEGTPVSELEVSYRFATGQLQNIPSGRGRTDIDGIFEVSTGTITRRSLDVQGQAILSFNVEATLPEIGRTSRSASVRVFINDIDVQAQATRTEENASLSVTVTSITLDRLNDGTASNNRDFLDEPVAGQDITVEIYRVFWERERIGEFYDWIERAVVPRYRWRRREEVIDNFVITTDRNGEANKYFQVPNRSNESYRARLTTLDGNNRTITRDIFIGRDFSSFFSDANDDRLFLAGARTWSEGYDIGDEVALTVNRGTDPITTGNVLFVIMQNGILDYHVGSNLLSFEFAEKHAPNITVYAYHFNGHTYYTDFRMSRSLRFNSQSRNLVLTVNTDQDIYRPSDMSTITITATDLDGNPKPTNINVSVVDEALFALRDYNVHTRESLYRIIWSGLQLSLATHRTFISGGLDIEMDDEDGGAFHRAREMSESELEFDSAPLLAAAPAATPAPDGGGDTHIREIFEDTATFVALRTDAQGQATFSFRLPDNITSWRVTVSGISDDLYAGNTVDNIIVTNPMFLHYSVNDIFLVGDLPTIGVNVFGTSLTGGETVTFEVWDENAPNIIQTATGAPFERVNIPLWEMTDEGESSFVIRAATNTGLSDAVRHEYRVINTHRQVDAATFYEVTVDTVFEFGSQGMTNITFTDQGRGRFLRDLMQMRNIRGSRIEALVRRREANRIIARDFPDIYLFTDGRDSFNPMEYQRPDGGIAIFPHAESDLAVTVRLMPFIMDDINVNALRRYLYNIFEGESADNKMRALYGLAMLREPVLLDLNNYALLEDLPIRDIAYIALGFAALGETATATALYNERIRPHLQRITPYYRVYTGANRSDILEATSIIALLAAKLQMPEREGLHRYTVRNHTLDLLVNIERLSFIVHEIENTTSANASITYSFFGEEITRDLSQGRSFTLRIPTQNINEFDLLSVTGEVGAVSINRVPLEDIEIVDNDITIQRRFYRHGSRVRTNTFEQGDLVRVELTVDFSRKDILGSYVVTDFLPAGLVPVSNSAGFGSIVSVPGGWRRATVEGQRVMFHIHNWRFNNTQTFFYYARVVSPGTFIAEGSLVQNLGAREYMTVGEDDVIVIRG